MKLCPVFFVALYLFGCGSSDPGDLVRGKSIDSWVEQLKSGDYGAQTVACEALEEAGKRAVEPLLEILSINDKDLTYFASKALKNIGPPAVDFLVKAYVRQKGEARIRVIGVLGSIGPAAKAAVPFLIESLKSLDQVEKWSALEALGAIGPAAKAAIPVIVDFLKAGKEPPLRGDEKLQVLSVLESLLQDEDEMVRQAAVRVLEKIRSPESKR